MLVLRSHYLGATERLLFVKYVANLTMLLIACRVETYSHVRSAIESCSRRGWRQSTTRHPVCAAKTGQRTAIASQPRLVRQEAEAAVTTTTSSTAPTRRCESSSSNDDGGLSDSDPDVSTNDDGYSSEAEKQCGLIENENAGAKLANRNLSAYQPLRVW
jgi:hypothetical protein